MLQRPLLIAFPILLALAGHGLGQRTIFVKSDSTTPAVPYTSSSGEFPRIALSDRLTIKITGSPGDWVFLFCRAYVDTAALINEAHYAAATITYIHPWFGPKAWNGADLQAVGLGAESSNAIPSNVPVAIEPPRMRNMIVDAVGFGPVLPLMRDLVKGYTQGIYQEETEVVWSGSPVNWSGDTPALTRGGVLASTLWAPLLAEGEGETEFELNKLIQQAIREQYLVTYGVLPTEDLVNFLIEAAAPLDLKLVIQAVVVSSSTGRDYQLPELWTESRGLDCIQPPGEPIPPTTDILEPMVIPVLLGFPATGSEVAPLATGLPQPHPQWVFVGTPGEWITFALPPLSFSDCFVDAIFQGVGGVTISTPAELQTEGPYGLEARVIIPEDATIGVVEFVETVPGSFVGMLENIPFGWGSGVYFIPMPPAGL
jgi:hypothetical protein